MKILIVEPGQRPRSAVIDGSLKSLREAVGGYILTLHPFEDPVAIVCDVEGPMKDLQWNRVINTTFVIMGTFIVCGFEKDDFTDLSDALSEKYTQRFYKPEIFVRMEHGIKRIRLS